MIRITTGSGRLLRGVARAVLAAASARLAVAVCIVGVATLAGSAMPAFGDDQGTVNAQVSVGTAGACITVEPAGAPVDFGTLPFSTPAGLSLGSGTPSPSATSCATTPQQLFARGTDATGTNALWGLGDPIDFQGCQLLDQYGVGLNTTGDPNDGHVFLSNASNVLLHELAAGATRTHDALITMPCTGSSGGGETMTMQIIYIAAV